MGEVDMERQELNVFRMRLLGAEVRPVRSGSRTLKDAVNEALRDWVATVESTHYCLGRSWDRTPSRGWCASSSACRRRGPRAVPALARRRDPDYVVACVGGGRNAAGTFAGFVDTRRPAGRRRSGRRGGARAKGVPGVLHGMQSYLLQDEFGQILEAHVDLRRPGLPGHRAGARLPGRAGPGALRVATDEEVLDALQLLARTEGIIPALEPAHALAWLVRRPERARCPPARPCF